MRILAAAIILLFFYYAAGVVITLLLSILLAYFPGPSGGISGEVAGAQDGRAPWSWC